MFDPSISEMVTTKSFDEDNVKTAMMLIDLYFEFIDRTQKKMNDALSRTSATMNSLENLTIIESPFEQEQKARAVLYFFDKAGTIKRVKVNFKQARSSVSELYPLIPGSLFEEFPFNLSETAIAHLQNEAADLNSNVYVVYSLSDEITIDSMIPKVLDNLQVSYTPKPRKTKPPVKYILIGDDCTKSPLYWLNKSGNPLQGWFFGNDTIPYAVIDELFDIISEHCKKRYKNDRKRVLAPLSPPTLPATDDKKLN